MGSKVLRSGRRSQSHREWRAECLRSGGFDAALAERLAGDTAFDLHALLELVDRGCPPHLAARILAPLETEVAR